MRDLDLTKVQMGYGFSAFALAYALFEIPGGWMGDWLGPRRVLLRIVTGGRSSPPRPAGSGTCRRSW